MPTLFDGPSAVSPPPQAATIAAAASAASFHRMSFILELLVEKIVAFGKAEKACYFGRLRRYTG
jgi:hypothetical protein